MSLSDQIFEQVPQWDQDKVRNARVLVVGAGALGNEVLKNLALLNVRQIAIMDFDHVESGNLSRSVLYRASDAMQGRPKAIAAAERLLEINHDLEILVQLGDVAIDLSLGLLAHVDVIIGCVDNRLARLYLNRLAWRAGKPWVDGGILNLSGQVAAYVPGQSCYECGLSSMAWADIRQRLGCTDMARRYAMSGRATTTPIAASIIGAIQVQEALKFVMQQENHSLAGRMFSYEGSQNHAAYYEQRPLKSECESHYPALETHSTPLSANTTVDEALTWFKSELRMTKPCILLDHSVATRLTSMQSGRGMDVILPLPHFSDRLAKEFEAELGLQIAVPKGALIEELREGDGFGDRRLSDFGIPVGHVLRVGRGEERKWIALDGDAPLFAFGKGIKHLPHRWWEFGPAEIQQKRGND